MKKEPILVIMAGGLGSRFGGLKQIVPVGLENEIILDYSLYDAYLSGFKRAVIIIKEENKEDFDKILDGKARKYLDISYAYQKLNDIPYSFPKDRTRPYGTAHAVLSAKDLIDAPFAVINSDDFYGRDCFKKLYDFLSNLEDDNLFTMVGYKVENTLAKNGGVNRGICKTLDNFLISVNEHLDIKEVDGKIIDKDYFTINPSTIVSMNCWGFSLKILDELNNRLPLFISEIGKDSSIYAINSKDLNKVEYSLPNVVDKLIKEGNTKVLVQESLDKWYGVTYKEEVEYIKENIKDMIDKNIYPSKLWR